MTIIYTRTREERKARFSSTSDLSIYYIRREKEGGATLVKGCTGKGGGKIRIGLCDRYLIGWHYSREAAAL